MCIIVIYPTIDINTRIPKWEDYPETRFFLLFWVLKIGHLKKGLNPPSSSELAFGSPYLGTAIKTGVVTGVIALAVSYHHLQYYKLHHHLYLFIATFFFFFNYLPYHVIHAICPIMKLQLSHLCLSFPS